MLIEFYQKYLSPLKKPCCRFVPSCSEYYKLSLNKHGFWKGHALGVWRILRCNPFSRGGVDLP